MATASVHCPTCNVDSTFEYPDAEPAGTVIKWEHGCPPYVEDAEGNAVVDASGNPTMQVPYVGVFTVPGS